MTKYIGLRSYLRENDDSDLQTIRGILNDSGITDEEIKSGLTLTQKAYHELAAAMGSDIDFVQSLINSLVKSLGGENRESVLSERGPRDIRGGDSIMDEITSDVGTMEFPWKLGARSGMATAAYKTEGDKFFIKVAAAYDDGGAIIPLTADEKRQLRRQAIAFIGQE